MYGRETGGLGGIFDSGGFFDDALKWIDKASDDVSKFVSEAGDSAKKAERAIEAAKAVARGDKQVALVPTSQGVTRYAKENPWVMPAVLGGAGLLLYFLLARRRR